MQINNNLKCPCNLLNLCKSENAAPVYSQSTAIYDVILQHFMCMLQVFFSVLSVLPWQNFSASYWFGVYTTSFWIGFIGFVCPQIILKTRLEIEALARVVVGLYWDTERHRNLFAFSGTSGHQIGIIRSCHFEVMRETFLYETTEIKWVVME